jgi:hypothetical protein
MSMSCSLLIGFRNTFCEECKDFCWKNNRISWTFPFAFWFLKKNWRLKSFEITQFSFLRRQSSLIMNSYVYTKIFQSQRVHVFFKIQKKFYYSIFKKERFWLKFSIRKIRDGIKKILINLVEIKKAWNKMLIQTTVCF